MRQPTQWENKSLPAIHQTEDWQNTQRIKKIEIKNQTSKQVNGLMNEQSVLFLFSNRKIELSRNSWE